MEKTLRNGVQIKEGAPIIQVALLDDGNLVVAKKHCDKFQAAILLQNALNVVNASIERQSIIQTGLPFDPKMFQ